MPTIATLLLALALSRTPQALEFLHGCWEGELDDGTHIEEQYTSGQDGLLLGQFKSSGGKQPVFFEWLEIRSDAENSWLTLYPRGQATTARYRLVEQESDKLVFEDPKRDFPRRITYRLMPDDVLLTQLAGVIDGRPVLNEFHTVRTRCGAASSE